jgi:XRE family transcriptional regulator, aerobic/anaerobic benzoate catabolism transcriptional regulator
VSERFLAQLESGTGNISLSRFADVAHALSTTPAELLVGAAPAAQPDSIIALLGVRGAGKSAVGTELARRRKVPFIEVDALIEEAAGLSLAQIFELHGEAYYRRVEREVLTRLLADPQPAILATGGSIVNHRDNYAILRDRCTTVWLRARAEDHWNRVVQQGDGRPMAKSPHAFAELRALIAAREPLYSVADHIVDTSGRSVDEVTTALSRSLGLASSEAAERS